MKLLSTLALAGLLVTSWACGKSDPAASAAAYSCSNPSMGVGVCLDFSTTTETGLASYATNACVGVGGTLSTTSACTATGRVGRCATVSHGYTTTFSYYEAAGMSASIVESTCTDNGDTYIPLAIDEEPMQKDSGTSEEN